MNTNGVLSFGKPFVTPPSSLNYYPPGVDNDVPTIAPFYADIDTTFQGNISVQEVNDTQLVDAVLFLINNSFEQTDGFTLSSFYNVSWEGVGRNSAMPDTVSS